MKKIILTTLISFGLAFAANAQKRGHNNGHDKNHNRSSHHSHQKSHNNHKSYHSKSHRSHNKHYNSHHRGHSITYTTQRIWIAGSSQRVWVPPRYEYRRQRCGTIVRVCVSHGYYNTVHQPGYYTYKRVPVRHRHGSGVSISWRF